jgi:hypothetical protein
MRQSLQNRRPAPPNRVGSATPSSEGVANIQKFNRDLRYIQGFSTTIPAGSTVPLTVSLNASGKRLLGLTFIPSLKTSDISNVTASLSVNNNNVLLNMSASNANPLDLQGMIFFPIPQPLSGKDSIIVNFTNNSAVQVVILTNIYYVPRS